MSLFVAIPRFRIFGRWRTLGGEGGGRLGAVGLHPPKAEFKNADFVDTISKVLRDLRFSLNYPLKLADD